MTYEKIVEKLRKAYAQADASPVGAHKAIQLNVRGEGEGALYIEAADGKFNVQPYEYYDNDAVVTIPSKILIDIMDGKAEPADAYRDLKFSVIGDENASIQILSLRKISETKKAVKSAEKTVKETAKKATDAVKATAKKAEKTVKETAEKVEKVTKPVADKTVSAAKKAAESVKPAAEKAGKAVKATGKTIKETAKKATEAAKTAKKATKAAVGAAKDTVKKVKTENEKTEENN